MKKIIIPIFLSAMVILAIGCNDEDACALIDCGANGICLDGTCQCDEGFSGTNCETNVCDSIDCGPNGTCNSTDGSCACNEGFEGDSCDLEIRQRFVGTYQGDILPCIPAALLLFLPGDIQESLMETPIEVAATNADVLLLDVGSNSMVLGLNVTANITEESFDITEFSQDLDVGGVAVTITASGTGTFVDEETLMLDLTINSTQPSDN